MTEFRSLGKVGPSVLADGADEILRLGKGGEQIVQELHGRFYEQTYRGAMFSGGMTALTSIAAATFTTGTLGATGTPIIGVWNPTTSGVNLVILQATLGLTMTALNVTGPGPFAWCSATGQAGITTGRNPVNRATLAASGSKAVDVAGVALSGLSGSQSIRWGSALFGGSASSAAFTATAAAMQTQQLASVENLDGSVIVPPGGVLSLLSTTQAVAHSAVSSLLWEEVTV